jgi:predicted signal transduction protein with EAL and GGDEF domain
VSQIAAESPGASPPRCCNQRRKILPQEPARRNILISRHLVSDENDAAITRAVITLGHSLKLKVIAEGIVTEVQLAQLRHDGCEEEQGYLYGEPVPADKIADLFRGRTLHVAASSF